MREQSPEYVRPGEYVTEADKRVSSLAAVNATRRCGGVFVNGAEPLCCEVHLLRWGHYRPGLQGSPEDGEAG